MKRTPLKRKTGLRRGRTLRPKKPWGYKPDNDRWVRIAAFLWPRSKGLCERCGKRVRKESVTKSNFHHILARGKGGDDTPENMAFLCGPMSFYGGIDYSCHSWVHSHPIQAKAEGWSK